jgi:hypothetical protein
LCKVPRPSHSDLLLHALAELSQQNKSHAVVNRRQLSTVAAAGDTAAAVRLF